MKIKLYECFHIPKLFLAFSYKTGNSFHSKIQAQAVFYSFKVVPKPRNIFFIFLFFITERNENPLKSKNKESVFKKATGKIIFQSL